MEVPECLVRMAGSLWCIDAGLKNEWFANDNVMYVCVGRGDGGDGWEMF